MSGGIVLPGERVILRPMRADEADLVYRAALRNGPLPPDRDRTRRMVERSGSLDGGRLALGIDVDGRLVGDISVRQPAGALPPGVYELGIDLFDEDDRGRGYGGEAVALLTEYVFSELGAARVQASTSVSNKAMRRVLERLGFEPEGVMRAFMPLRDGSRDDYVLYARTRGGAEGPFRARLV